MLNLNEALASRRGETGKHTDPVIGRDRCRLAGTGDKPHDLLVPPFDSEHVHYGRDTHGKDNSSG